MLLEVDVHEVDELLVVEVEDEYDSELLELVVDEELLVVEEDVVEDDVVELEVVELEVVDEVVDEVVEEVELLVVEEVVDEVDEEDDESLKAIPINPQSSALAVPKATVMFPALPVSRSYSSPQVWFPTSSVLSRV